MLGYRLGWVGFGLGYLLDWIGKNQPIATSRYDHYAILCEILPVAIPSLCICLQILLHGKFDEQIHIETSQILGFCEKIPIVSFSEISGQISHQEILEAKNFPGFEIFYSVNFLANLISRMEKFFNSEFFRGWLNFFNVERNFTNPAHLEKMKIEVEEILQKFLQIENFLKSKMAPFFSTNSIVEFCGQHIQPCIKKLRKTLQKLNQQILLAK